MKKKKGKGEERGKDEKNGFIEIRWEGKKYDHNAFNKW